MDRQVSAVYQDAKVEFDTSGVRLHASPAPLLRRPIRLATVAALTAPAAPQPCADGFLPAFQAALGEALARAWLSDATIEATEEGLVLFAGTRFKADYIRQTFGADLERVAKTCGLSAAPAVRERPRPPL